MVKVAKILNGGNYERNQKRCVSKQINKQKRKRFNKNYNWY